MQIKFKSVAGTIRESNNDYVLINHHLGLLVLVGGVMNKDQEHSRSIAEYLETSLKDSHSSVSTEDADYRLNEEITKTSRKFSVTGTESFIVAMWLVDGILLKASIGNVGIFNISENSISLLCKVQIPSSQIDSEKFKVTRNSSILIVSEGIVRAINLKDLRNKLEIISRHELQPNKIIEMATSYYDGDDLTAILINFSEKDTQKNTPEEIILKTHFDKKITMKIWQPLALIAGVFVTLLYLARKIYLSIKKKIDFLQNKNINI